MAKNKRQLGTMWVGILALSIPALAAGKSNWRVTSANLQSHERAKDCSVFKSVAWHALEAQRAREKNAVAIEAMVKERRVVLEKCGTDQGLNLTGELTEDEDRILAEMCPAPYADWLGPGYRFHSIRSEIREYATAAETLNLALRFHCGVKEIRELRLELPAVEKPESDEVPSAELLTPQSDSEALPGATPKFSPLKAEAPQSSDSSELPEFEKAVD